MSKGGNLTIPIAIVVAGILIAGAVFLSGNGNQAPEADNADHNAGLEEQEVELRLVSEDDHILGNPNAPIVVIEYSDLECPFCKNFHETMHRVIDEYGTEGSVAWVYRHFPLASIHSKAPREAEASECAAELGGNDAFWKYVDRIFEITPGNNGLDLDLLPEVAEEIGLDRTAFESCLESGRYTDAIESSFNEAVAAGGRGTPYNVVIAQEQQIVIPGARSFSDMKALIDSVLSQTQ